MKVGVPESLKDMDTHQRSHRIPYNFAVYFWVCIALNDSLPVQKQVSSWDPTAAGLSSNGRPRGWRLGSTSSDYWGHTEASGNSLHLLAGILQTSRSGRPGQVYYTHNIDGDDNVNISMNIYPSVQFNLLCVITFFGVPKTWQILKMVSTSLEPGKSGLRV